MKDIKQLGPRIKSGGINYAELWQYFESRGLELKGTMLQVVTWPIGFAVALLGYAVDQTVSLHPVDVEEPLLLIVLSVVGIAVVWYADIVISEFGDHINRSFDRADYSRIGDRSLDEILAYREEERKTKALPRICITVRRITRAFGVVFAVGLLGGAISVIT